MRNSAEKPNHRPKQIAKLYSELIDRHLIDLLAGKAEQLFDIGDFASALCIHPTHLSNVIRQQTGLSACGVFQYKIAEAACSLLNDRALPIKDVAAQLSFEPAQFTKWFKRINSITPKEYRAGKPVHLKY